MPDRREVGPAREAEMSLPIRTFLLVESLAFLGASLVHAGVLAHGYEHAKASTAEAVIGTALLAGLAVALAAADRARAAALWAQGFAFLGTMVGLLTIAVGVGPRTGPDLAFHGLILALLGTGLLAAFRGRPGAPRGSGLGDGGRP